MLLHHPPPLCKRYVYQLISRHACGPWDKAQILRIWNSREEPRLHRLRSTIQRGLNLSVPLCSAYGFQIPSPKPPHTSCGLIHTVPVQQLKHTNALASENVKSCLGQNQFHLVQRLKRLAKMHKNQIALMSKLREQSRLRSWASSAMLEFLQNRSKLFNHLRAFAVRARPPSLPVKTEELMQQCRPFKRERNGRKLSQRKHLNRALKSTQS